MVIGLPANMIFGDIIFNLNASVTGITFAVLFCIISFLLGYMACDNHWKTRNHGPMPRQNQGRVVSRPNGPPVVK